MIFLHYYVLVQHVLYLYQPTEAEWRTYLSCLAPGHYLNQNWVIGNWTNRSIFQWNMNRSTFSWIKTIFDFKDIVCKVPANLFSTRYVGSINSHQCCQSADCRRHPVCYLAVFCLRRWHMCLFSVTPGQITCSQRHQTKGLCRYENRGLQLCTDLPT